MSTKAAAAKEICGSIPPRYGASQRGHSVWFVLAAITIAGGAILYLFNPAQFGFYPVCFFYKTTGLLCPGCGTLRAMHQLLHGHIGAALRFNALIVLSIPLAIAVSIRAVRNSKANRLGLAGIRPSWLWLGLAVLLVFAILRNLPGASNYWLAP
jgi:hypothetical protein